MLRQAYWSRGSLQQVPLLAATVSSSFKPASILVPVDHFNSTDTRVYANRYLINADFYQRGGPVLVYDEGEQGMPDRFSPSHPAVALAERLGGLVVVWEHRFYGKSLPLALDEKSTQLEQQAAYQYLNTEQALEDVVFLATHFEPPELEDVWIDLQPERAPWIWIGGSYAGQRAAMIRNRNPDIFRAAWSSSAPVETAIEFPEYFLKTSRELPKACRQVIRDAVQHVDDTLLWGSMVKKSRLRWAIARRWPADRPWISKVAFAILGLDFHVASHLMGIVARDWQVTGIDGRMTQTCKRIQSADHNDIEGMLGAVLDAIEANNQYFGQPTYNRDQQAWSYQVCTEYPFFRTSATDSQYNILSSFLTTDSIWRNTCARDYPWLTYPSDMSISLRYAGWERNMTNTMFTAGLNDPWHGRSMLPAGGLVPGAPDRNATREIPARGQSPPHGQVFGLLFEHGWHCSDLVAGNAEAGEAVDLFEQAVRVWLPELARTE
ncbi:hypothetical protein LTR53_008029 [Teratosphaeriaceae sp. CCFEE 6253]|nr:hypothetical protein LTR53_008029 [Teratosphaeriaceae sp. CCFEE 6253]